MPTLRSRTAKAAEKETADAMVVDSDDAGKPEYDEYGEIVSYTPANFVLAHGMVGGRRIVVEHPQQQGRVRVEHGVAVEIHWGAIRQTEQVALAQLA